jgi:hypothetical protein
MPPSHWMEARSSRRRLWVALSAFAIALILIPFSFKAGGRLETAFAAFMLGNFLIIKMLGFTLAVAVLIDATVVRMVIGPALLQIAGDWNWWPLGLRGSKATPIVEVAR